MTNYYKDSEAEGAMSILAGWMGKNNKVKVLYHGGKDVCANIETSTIKIPKLACASGVTHEALMVLRAQVYHESGHIADTKISKDETPKGAHFSILNSLEDRRIERNLANEHEGARMVFNWANDFFNKKIAGQVASGETKNASLWEALCAMNFMAQGMTPAWRLTSKAQAYVDAAYGEYVKVGSCESTKDCLKLADKIYEILKDKNEELKEQNKEDQGKDKDQDKGKDKSKEKGGKDQKQEKGEDEENSDSDSSNDFEDEEKPESEKGNDSEDKGGSKDSEKQDQDKDDGSNSDDGDNAESDDKDSDKDSGNSSGSDDENKDSDKKSNGDLDSELGNESDETLEGSASKKLGAEGKYKPSDDGEYTTSLEEETDGTTCQEILNEKLNELFAAMNPDDKNYLALREYDEHQVIPVTDYDKQRFIEKRDSVSVTVASMSRALEQALRSLAKCRKNPYLRHGKIDEKRLVQIAKGLSKEVFYRDRLGETLDVAVEIIIDESFSMRNYEEIQLLALAMGESLEKIGIPFEITGTTTKYHGGDGSIKNMDGFSRTNPIIYKHYKTFGEKWSSVRSRIVNTRNHLHNVDGETVEYAAMRLTGRKEGRKVIFSLSDGEPCGGQGTDTLMAGNLKKVCERCRKNGIEVIGVGVGTELPRSFYGDKYFVFLKNAGEMGEEFVRRFADIITKGKVNVR